MSWRSWGCGGRRTSGPASAGEANVSTWCSTLFTPMSGCSVSVSEKRHRHCLCSLTRARGAGPLCRSADRSVAGAGYAHFNCRSRPNTSHAATSMLALPLPRGPNVPNWTETLNITGQSTVTFLPVGGIPMKSPWCVPSRERTNATMCHWKSARLTPDIEGPTNSSLIDPDSGALLMANCRSGKAARSTTRSS